MQAQQQPAATPRQQPAAQQRQAGVAAVQGDRDRSQSPSSRGRRRQRRSPSTSSSSSSDSSSRSSSSSGSGSSTSSSSSSDSSRSRSRSRGRGGRTWRNSGSQQRPLASNRQQQYRSRSRSRSRGRSRSRSRGPPPYRRAQHRRQSPSRNSGHFYSGHGVSLQLLRNRPQATGRERQWQDSRRRSRSSGRAGRSRSPGFTRPGRNSSRDRAWHTGQRRSSSRSGSRDRNRRVVRPRSRGRGRSRSTSRGRQYQVSSRGRSRSPRGRQDAQARNVTSRPSSCADGQLPGQAGMAEAGAAAAAAHKHTEKAGRQQEQMQAHGTSRFDWDSRQQGCPQHQDEADGVSHDKQQQQQQQQQQQEERSPQLPRLQFEHQPQQQQQQKQVQQFSSTSRQPPSSSRGPVSSDQQRCVGGDVPSSLQTRHNPCHQQPGTTTQPLSNLQPSQQQAAVAAVEQAGAQRQHTGAGRGSHSPPRPLSRELGPSTIADQGADRLHVRPGQWEDEPPARSPTTGQQVQGLAPHNCTSGPLPTDTCAMQEVNEAQLGAKGPPGSPQQQALCSPFAMPAQQQVTAAMSQEPYRLNGFRTSHLAHPQQPVRLEPPHYSNHTQQQQQQQQQEQEQHVPVEKAAGVRVQDDGAAAAGQGCGLQQSGGADAVASGGPAAPAASQAASRPAAADTPAAAQQQQVQQEAKQVAVAQPAPSSSPSAYQQQQQQLQQPATAPPQAGVSGASEVCAPTATTTRPRGQGLIIHINRVPSCQQQQQQQQQQRTSSTGLEPAAVAAGRLTSPAGGGPGGLNSRVDVSGDMDISPRAAAVPGTGPCGSPVAGSAAAAAAGLTPAAPVHGQVPSCWGPTSQQQQLQAAADVTGQAGSGGGWSRSQSPAAVAANLAGQVERGRAALDHTEQAYWETYRKLDQVTQHVWFLCSPEGVLYGQPLQLSALLAHYPTGLTASGQCVCVARADMVQAGQGAVSQLLEAVTMCQAREQQLRHSLALQMQGVVQHLAQLRQLVSQYLCAMCSTQLQQGCCWVWTNPPGGQTHPSLLTYEQVLAATTGCPPQAVSLVAVPPSSHPAAAAAAPSGPRVSLAALQQQRAQADRLAAAVGNGLPDSSFYLRQLPYFDDTTPCWQLWGSSSQAYQLSINQLRARLQSQEVPLHQLVSHIWDGQGRPAWVYELCMLRMLDKAYEDRSAQVEAQQQQQQQQQHTQLAHPQQQQQAAAAVSFHAAAAGRPLAQHTVPALHQQQQQHQPQPQQQPQPMVSPMGLSWQAPPGQQQQQPMWHQQEGSGVQQQQQVVQDARAPLPSSHPQQLQQHLWSPLQWRQQQQHQQLPSLMQQQQQQQAFGVLQHQRAAVGVHSTPGAPSPPAPSTPPAATQEAGSPAGPAIPVAAAAAVDAAVALAGVSSSSRPAAAAGAAAPPLPLPLQQQQEQQQVVGAGGTNQQQQQQSAVHGDQAGAVCTHLQVRARAILRRVLLSPELLQEIRATFFQPKTDPATVSLPCGPEGSGASQAAAPAPGAGAASVAGASSSSSRGPLPPHSRPAAADPAGRAGQITAAAAAAAGNAAVETAAGGVPPAVRRGGSLQQYLQPPPSEEKQEEEAGVVGVQQQDLSRAQVMAVVSQQDSRTAPRVPAAAAAVGPHATQLLAEGLVSKGTTVLDTHVPPAAAQHESSPAAKKPEDTAAGAAAVERLQLDSPLASSALQADRLLGRLQQQQQQEQRSERQPSISPAKRRKVLWGHEEGGGLAAAADVVRSAVQFLDPDTRAAVLEATGVRRAHQSSSKVQQGAERPQQQLARLSQPQQQQQGGAQQVSWHKRRRSTDTAGSSADVDEATQQEIRSAALGLRARTSSQQQQQQSQEQQASKLNAPAMLAAAFPSSAARSRTRRPCARSASAPAAGRAASAEPLPPVLTGCARGLPLTEARAAAAACKKPGYCHGLHQLLMRRERLQDHRTAAAAAGVTTGPYGSRAQLVPYALPASLLRLDRDKPAAAATSSRRGEGGLTASASRAGTSTSRSQRALRGEPSARNTQLLAEAKRRQAARPPGKALALQRSGVHGYGLFAAERIAAGEFVIEYVGEIIRPVLEDLVEARYEAAGQCSSYLFTIDKAQVADATVRGGRARYINHCCDPNCRPKEFYGPDGVARMGIYAHRDIELGEELHYNYHFEFEDEDRRVPCYCGAANCSGWMNWEEGVEQRATG